MRSWMQRLGSALITLALACAACAPSANSTATPAAQMFRIGVITQAGPIADKSFNQAAWAGAQAAAQAVGGAAEYIETQTSKDYAANIARFGDQGYDVIITIGFGLSQATLVAARRYPASHFIGVDQFSVDAPPNLAGLIFHEDQAGYLAGVLAAKMTKTGVIAAVLGSDLVPPIVAFKEGYAAGAKSARADVRLIADFYPGGLDTAFSDPDWGAATAGRALEQGADVVFGAGGLTGSGALRAAAARVATNPDTFCIGVDSDQWETVPEARPCLLSSAMKLIEPGVVALVRQAKDGQFPSGNFFGDVGLAPFHGFDSQIPAEVKALLDVTVKGLKDGSITTGYVSK